MFTGIVMRSARMVGLYGIVMVMLMVRRLLRRAQFGQLSVENPSLFLGRVSVVHIDGRRGGDDLGSWKDERD